jgi:hypothetical protein
MQEQSDLARSARRLRILALTVAAALAIATVAGAVFPDGSASPNGVSRSWGILIAAITIALAIASLFELAAMLREVENGRVFARATMRRFRRFAALFLTCAVANTALPPIAQLTRLVMDHGHGEVTVSLSDSGMLTLLAGVLMFFIARMFDEAVRLDDDYRSIV